MFPINIKFQAYIPKSLGKSLLSYFQFDPRFNPKVMLNYYEFKQQLEQADRKGFKWLPEPGNFISNYFFATDNADFHNLHNEHTGRLSINMNFDVAKIGSFSIFDSNEIFKHYCGISKQHSDASHRIEAFIKNDKAHDFFGDSKDIKYKGICSSIKYKTSEEKILNKSIQNTMTGSYFSQQGTKVKEDTSIIEASAAAGYPFIKFVAPDIDFKIQVKLYHNGNSVEITVKGEHNDFPAYELIIDNKVIYNYNPSNFGYNSGPNPYNLAWASTRFSRTVLKSLNNWE
jgi:predicted RNA-binding protein Jag